jgi:hypothetical protein
MPLVKHPTLTVVTQFGVARPSWPCPFTGRTPAPRQIDPTATLTPQKLEGNRANARQSQGPVAADSLRGAVRIIKSGPNSPKGADLAAAFNHLGERKEKLLPLPRSNLSKAKLRSGLESTKHVKKRPKTNLNEPEKTGKTEPNEAK